MRVISNGLQEKEVTCNYCKSVLAYTKVDMSSDYGEYVGELYCIEWVVCPVCKRRVFL